MAYSSLVVRRLTEIGDKNVLARFFERDEPLHLYEIGDLDPFFWPDTRWFGWTSDHEPLAVALLYTGISVPTLLLLERIHGDEAASLLRALRPYFPECFYAHLSPGLIEELADLSLVPHGRHLKMMLTSPEAVMCIATRCVERLNVEDQEELCTLYDRSYPGHWFSPRMLETGQYFGLRSEGALVSAAGVHVYAPRRGVAALGNITTIPERRGEGLGRRVTARLCQSLLASTRTIGLNVRADNEQAIRCYRGLGFEAVAQYDEYMVKSSAP